MNRNLAGGLFLAKPTPLTIKESSLSAQIAEWLEDRMIYNDRLQAGEAKSRDGYFMKLCKPGTPDRFAIVHGRIIFIEVKRLGEKPSNQQLERHEEIRQSGAIVLIVDSFNSFVSELNSIRAGFQHNTRKVKLYD